MVTKTQSMPNRISDTAQALPKFTYEWLEGTDERVPILREEDSSFFHQSAWIDCLANSYGYKPKTLIQKCGDECTARIPFLEVDSWLTGKRGVSLPFTDYCPPLCASSEAFQQAFKEIVEYGAQRNWKYIEFRDSTHFSSDIEPSTRFHSHRLKLQKTVDSQFDRLASSTRRAIRKANNSELKMVTSRSLEDLKTFYKLQCITRRRHGLPAQPYSFFKNIYKNILSSNQGIIFLATLNGAPAAGALFLNYKKKTIYKYGASDITIQSTRANNFVMWEAIKWHIENGFDELHFGRSSLAHEGLRAYKLRWGAEEGSINYYRYDLVKKTFTTQKDAVSGWYNKIFKTIPLFMSQAISSLIYKHVA